MVALYNKKETGKTRRAQRPAGIETSVKQESPDSDPSLELGSVLEDPFPLLMETTQCPDCIGDEQLPVEARKLVIAARRYSTTTSTTSIWAAERQPSDVVRRSGVAIRNAGRRNLTTWIIFEVMLSEFME